MTNKLPETLTNKLEKNKNKLKLSNTYNISRSIAENILIEIQEKYGFSSKEESMVIIAIFSQLGATSPKCSGNMTFNYENQEFKLSDIRRIFQKHGAKNQMRKFARTYGTTIFQICKILDIPGNMFQKVKKLQPNIVINKDHKYWLSDYQAYNEDAPSEARDLIIMSFPKNSSTNKNKKK